MSAISRFFFRRISITPFNFDHFQNGVDIRNRDDPIYLVVCLEGENSKFFVEHVEKSPRDTIKRDLLP